jgi:C1A family cysteine protease
MMCKKVGIQGREKAVGTGWLLPMPDMRDYTEGHPDISGMLKKLGVTVSKKSDGSLPGATDLRQWCSPIEDQGGLGSCTAQAAVGIAEYFQRRAFGKHIDGSRLFVYKATRNLMGVTGDTGAWLRQAMGALVLCGVPPEKYWPYSDEEEEFDREPSPFAYAIADNYEAVKYFCHDPVGEDMSRAAVLDRIKLFLSCGIPSAFGFFGFPSFERADVKGGIPYPCPGEQAEWGHAIAAVGYDDKVKIKNLECGKETIGALLIRNSWGTRWGDEGYGWLPYDYVRKNLALDFWSLLSMEWVDTEGFGV